MTRPCACAPGCINTRVSESFCKPCLSAWWYSPERDRVHNEGRSERTMLADFARTRSAELLNGGKA